MFVYQPGDLPEPAQFIERWQKMAHDAGLGGLYLVASLGEASYLGESAYRSHVSDGFDAAIYFQFPFKHDSTTWARERLLARGLIRGPMRYPYAEAATAPPPGIGGRLFPSVYPNWDNTPRLGRRGLVATGSTPEHFARHVRKAIELASANPAGEQVVMVKSWNEWAEGNYLEPDAQFGLGRLEAMRAELARAGGPDHRSTPSTLR
jgi:hypothetical protein